MTVSIVVFATTGLWMRLLYGSIYLLVACLILRNQVATLTAVMLAAPRAETIRKAEKVFLVYLVEDGDHGMLDNLVFQSRNPQWALPSICFLDVHSSRWLCSVGFTMNSAMEIDQSIFNPDFPLCDSSQTYTRAVWLLPSPADLLPGLTTDASEVSRFSCMKFLGVSGVFDYAGLSTGSRYRSCSCCLPRILTGMKQRMRNSYGKGVAIHSAPSLALITRGNQ